MLELGVLTKEDCEQVRQWRNKNLEALRTPYMLTKEMQESFYENVVCNRNSNSRYWGIYSKKEFIGMVGIENIQWENRIGEISLIISPVEQGNGYGKQAVDLVLREAFKNMNLKTVWGECYYCNPAIGFWRKIINKYNAKEAALLNRKYYNGHYWNSLYFSIDRDAVV